MSTDHRIVGAGGARLPFSCENHGYRTNITKGCWHGTFAPTLGSVFSKPLIHSNGCSLWLEHVAERAGADEYYWLIWYDSAGVPTLPMSAVFGKADLREMVSLLTDFVP